MITHGVVVARRWSLVLVILVLPLCYGDRVSISHHNKLDNVHNYLKRFNKPPLKSIKPRWGYNGDIIDCAHIPHQPLFNYPLLKNHTIQMRPSYYPKRLLEENNVSIPNSNEGILKPFTQLWHLDGDCPKATIPIRTKKEDVLKASSIKGFGKKKHRTIPEPT